MVSIERAIVHPWRVNGKIFFEGLVVHDIRERQRGLIVAPNRDESISNNRLFIP